MLLQRPLMGWIRCLPCRCIRQVWIRIRYCFSVIFLPYLCWGWWSWQGGEVLNWNVKRCCPWSSWDYWLPFLRWLCFRAIIIWMSVLPLLCCLFILSWWHWLCGLYLKKNWPYRQSYVFYWLWGVSDCYIKAVMVVRLAWQELFWWWFLPFPMLFIL